MAELTDISTSLWNEAVGPSDFSEVNERYNQAVFEQYKLCVEMADRVSARRNLTNTFFLSLNSAVVAVTAAALGGEPSSGSALLAVAGLTVLLAQCAAWFVIVRSYRQLNAAKYAVVGAFEQRLPAYAYSRAEWRALGEGRDWRRYLPLTHVEQWVPVTFAVAYVLGFCAFVS
ncbi:RipA family octameric membrane protein [Streptomyces parvulus]|uniref:RipA family octameric membrane protein n=1 Tax=Streptomyces parvulus TaxID=146923 RepID=UPI003408AE18